MTQVNKFGIDVETKDKKNLIRRLKRLKSTMSVTDGGCYHEDLNYSQVWIETTKESYELDNWLYDTKGVDYVGTWDFS